MSEWNYRTLEEQEVIKNAKYGKESKSCKREVNRGPYMG